MNLYSDMFAHHIEHHEARARMWREAGLEDYADGSARKALKWRAKAREFDISIYGAMPPTMLQAFLIDHVRQLQNRFQDLMENAIHG